jgi:suppressor of ftsI
MVLADIVPHSPGETRTHAAAEEQTAPTHKSVDLTRYENTLPDFTAVFTEDKNGFYIIGQRYQPAAGPMTSVHVGTYQHWKVVNDTREIHLMHIHQVHFLAYQINGRRADHPFWLDTVNVPVDGSVDVIMDFTDPVIKGMSVFIAIS